jgi:hypothetical protein
VTLLAALLRPLFVRLNPVAYKLGYLAGYEDAIDMVKRRPRRGRRWRG